MVVLSAGSGVNIVCQQVRATHPSAANWPDPEYWRDYRVGQECSCQGVYETN
jgi:hypothetical protein